MAQAAVESPADASVANADDLLSQLAGQEIDRLLAESGEAAPKAETEPASPLPEQPVEESTAPAGEDPFAAQVDQLFRELNAVPLEQQPELIDEPALAPVEPKPVAPKAPLPAMAAPEPEPEQPTTAAERAALEEPVAVPEPVVEEAPPVAPTSAAPAPPAPVEPEPVVVEVKAPRVSVLVRILEIVNAPLAHCPDQARDALGKIAILTMMNAIGVLFYLMLFKK